ncbi:MAG: CoA-binding protein [Armatimonadetes bacterium CG2_30_59_28]|nr:CoA-binding protein [Armatimonadota bacterium]OIO92739.1 MAG: CoA-binding protein [Armatimonadetes bacterium CG2_30_59_28]PIU66803.1 MAG: CoA-binding protein [Armatimonadetes bacterium CG07_land_8_20_14_0_80_59_28]PIX41514.1 MAG: CoA-binding protein [Armatimonadetes bacterium CG_4_8_14_3_um_filter_58_9]PIY47864.1 MAG: CoA-binding protein [Armatimonadetes bacterium CG_4_10_14_3_um_filter_59_10]
MDYRSFWNNDSYAVVGHSQRKPFPTISYGKLKERGKKVFPVDPSVQEIKGEVAYPDFVSLPEAVDAAVLELPRDETKDWVEKAAAAGIRNVWIHMGRETPEAIALAAEKGLNLWYGTCAVMYLSEGFSVHSIHAWVNKALKRY